MKFKKSPPLPEPTLERRLQEIELLAQDKSFDYMQKIVCITSGLIGYIHAKDISFNDIANVSNIRTLFYTFAY